MSSSEDGGRTHLLIPAAGREQVGPACPGRIGRCALNMLASSTGTSWQTRTGVHTGKRRGPLGALDGAAAGHGIDCDAPLAHTASRDEPLPAVVGENGPLFGGCCCRARHDPGSCRNGAPVSVESTPPEPDPEPDPLPGPEPLPDPVPDPPTPEPPGRLDPATAI